MTSIAHTSRTCAFLGVQITSTSCTIRILRFLQFWLLVILMDSVLSSFLAKKEHFCFVFEQIMG